jgi:arylsulfatase A-like enzyme
MKKKPNILLIQVDQMHYRLMSCAGDPDIKTPNIDRIANTGVRFTNAFCPSSICQASRVAMFTGNSVHTTGVYENAGIFRDDLYSLVGHLAGAGYQTATIGKTHFVPQWPKHSFEVIKKGDFSECLNSRDENEYYMHVKNSGMGAYFDLLGEANSWGELGALPSRLPLELSQEFWLANAACDFFGNHDINRPFFCHASFSRPHNPWMPSAPFHKMYDPDQLKLPPTDPLDWQKKPFRNRERWHNPKLNFYYPRMTEKALRRALALYYGLISQIDAQIGRILNRLEELNLSNNTIIVFTSDHGDFAGDHGIIDKGVPTLDGIWRVPFLISDPRDLSNKGVVRDQLINLIDLMPTLYEKVGIDLPKCVEGKSFVREISDSTFNGRNAEFYEFRHVKTVRTKDFVMSYYSPGEEGFKEYAHSSCGFASGGELYDLKKDPNQFNNLFDDIAYREIRLSLTEKLLEWFCNTERVHRSTVVTANHNPNTDFDFNGMTKNDYKKKYLENHPLLNKSL